MRAVALLLLVLGAGPAYAQTETRAPVVVTPGAERTYRVAVQRFHDASAAPDPSRAAKFREAVLAALEYSGAFTGVGEPAYLAPVESPAYAAGATLVCSDWSQIGVDVLVQGEYTYDESQFSASFRIWDIARCRDLLRRRYAQASNMKLSGVAYRIADDVVEAFLGVRGVSGTEIAFVSDRSGNKEIYVMNADGSDQRAATANGSINTFPDWSPSGDAIVYTSYRYRDQPLLFVSSRGRLAPGRLLPDLGDGRPEYRGVLDPAGERIALVASEPGSASDIFTVLRSGRGLRRLTNNRSIEVSPTWSPDGERLAFVSDRTGSPQIYIMDADGSNQRRLTYNGDYNTGPAWSPDGLWIAYETRVNGQFDIWLIDPEGSVNVPLVTHPRSDESPSWAPNSRTLVFSSTRRGRADLYMMDRDGSNLRRLTEGAGNNTSPAWGPFPR
jgi:TolB protein